MASYYEIGGQIFDGSFGYDHRQFKRAKRAYSRGQHHVVADIAANVVFDKIKQINQIEEIPYSDMQLAARRWAEKNRRRVQRITAALPLPAQVKVPFYAAPAVVEMWSYGTGSYDLRTPSVRRYEESVTWGGSGGMII
jgi:hypothetical protein